MFRRSFLVLLLTACIVACMVPVTYALDESAPTVKINNNILSEDNPYYKNDGEGGTYGTASDYNAYFDVQAGTLTLQNLDIQTWRKSGIVSTGDLTLILKGDNYIKITCSVNDNKVYFYGIDADNLTIRGSGSLTIPYVQGRYGPQNTYGILASDLLIESGTVSIPYAYDASISATSFSITGGNVSATCGSYGITAQQINISGGSVTAFGFTSGIQASRSLLISGGEVSTGRRNDETSDQGICTPIFSMTGGTVNAYASDEGLSCSTGFYQSGGSLTIHADSTATYYDRQGIDSGSSGMVYLSGGELEIFSSSGAFTKAPVFSSCCSYQMWQGSSDTSASSTTPSNLDHTSLYVYGYSSSSGHTLVQIPAVAPTCTENGSTAATQCSKCTQYLIAPVTVYKISHNYNQTNTDSIFLKKAASCSSAAVYYHSCVCGAMANGTYNLSTFTYGEPLPHTEVIDAYVAPTCGESGLSEGKHCSVCKKVLTAQEELPATGDHGYQLIPEVPATCADPGLSAGADCPTCGLVHVPQTEIPATGDHGYQLLPEVPATCVTPGLTAGSNCPTCGLLHVAQESIPATGHTEVTDPAVPSTCKEPGLTEGSHCAVCGEVFVAQQSVPKTSHTFVMDPPKSPTCEEAGTSDTGMHCSACGDILISQTEIPALGHDYGAGVVTVAPTCMTTGVLTYTCNHDATHTKTEELAIASDAHAWNAGNITTVPTCSVEGVRTFTCVYNEAHTKTEIVAIDGSAHAWNDGIVTTAPTCIDKGEKTFACIYNAAHTKTEEVMIDVTAHKYGVGVVTEPTCTEEGYTNYTCQCGDNYVANVVPALGHSYTVVFVWAEDLSSVEAVATCYCGHTEKADGMISWDSSDPYTRTVTALAAIAETLYTDSMTIAATVHDNTVTITLPEIFNLQVIVARYEGSQMTGCALYEVTSDTITFELTDGTTRLFFLTNDYCPISPQMLF